MNKRQSLLPLANTLLLTVLCFTIFIIPVFPVTWYEFLYPPAFTIIFLSAAYSIRTKKRILTRLAIGLTVVFYLAVFIQHDVLRLFSRILQIVFFILMVILLVQQTAASAVVTKGVILDSISGFMLLGFAFSMLVIIITYIRPDAYSFGGSIAEDARNFEQMSTNIYYTFVTYSTTGYGDIIPIKPYARSLAIMIGVSGQLYPAIIIAMLVGKYAAKQDAA